MNLRSQPRAVSLARVVIAPVVIALGLLIGPMGQPGALADITIIGDDDQDAFVGSGSLLLPPQIATDWRTSAANCPGCVWRSVIQCEMTSAGACRGPARLCGPDGYWLRVFLTRPGGVEQNLGAACFGPGGPVKRETAEALLRDRVLALVPPLRAWRQPDGLALPHIPVAFGVTQQEEPIRESFELVGLPIDLTARPRWTWDFGTSALVTTSSGRRWPDTTIAHTYRRSGAQDVSVTALWSATYLVAGVGPLEVAEPVTQRTDLRLSVGQGRAVLVR
ncbi:MAG: hypothetical protein RL347_855 [Actinomycetota bacterium]|jgi:hypothetical protein